MFNALASADNNMVDASGVVDVEAALAWADANPIPQIPLDKEVDPNKGRPMVFLVFHINIVCGVTSSTLIGSLL